VIWFAFAMSIWLLFANGVRPRVWNCQLISGVGSLAIYVIPSAILLLLAMRTEIAALQLIVLLFALLKVLYRGAFLSWLWFCATHKADGLTSGDNFDYI